MKNPYIQAWHHVAFSCKDIKPMIAFFRDSLGFEVDWEHEKRSGKAMDEVVGLTDADAHVAMMKGYGTRVELFQYRNPKGRDLGSRQQCDPGLIHICLQVNNIKELYQQLLEQGVDFNCPPNNLRPGVWATYMIGPEDLTIELVQYDESQ